LLSARSGETYNTLVSSASRGPCRAKLSIAERYAASVFPVPVGAEISVWLPPRMCGQPSRCGSVGSPKRSENQRWIVGWKPVRGMMSVYGDAGPFVE
jgi:hypothetical protein